MLSSAHILAMDTKNLLDVCDSIRMRYPHVKYELPEGAVNINDPENAGLPQQLSTQTQLQSPLQQEVYENVSVASAERIEVAAEQLYCNQNAPADVGIYDNQTTIQEQLKIVEEPTSPVDAQFNSQKILSN